MNLDATYISIVLVVILISMILHELAHGYVSYFLGDDTAKQMGRLTLNPLKHLDLYLSILLPLTLAIVGAPIFGGAKPVPYNPKNIKWGEWGASLVAIAGPLTNFILALVGYLTIGLFHLGEKELLGQFFIIFTYVNLGFFAFNILPIIPLDGSRVLYALAPEVVKRTMEYLERYALIALLFIVVFFTSQISSVIQFISAEILILFQHLFSL